MVRLLPFCSLESQPLKSLTLERTIFRRNRLSGSTKGVNPLELRGLDVFLDDG